MQPKTISYSRTRKVNPALIHPKYQYGSEEISFTAWADIPEEADIRLETDNLKGYVEAEIALQISTLIEDLRSKAGARNYTWNAIVQAFSELMKSQHLKDDDIQAGLERFATLLEKYMAAETV